VVALVGAGPGDPGLLTRRGAELLADAEVVVFDRLASPALVDLAPRDAAKIEKTASRLFAEAAKDSGAFEGRSARSL
jgi:uroporphyrinogen III methyltransferase/synthase